MRHSAPRSRHQHASRRRHPAAAVLLVVLVLLTAAGGGVRPADAASAPGYDWSTLDDELTVATDGCSLTCGLVVHLQRRWADGGAGPHQTLLFDAWGQFTTSKEVWTASAGKLITGITALTVVDDGLLSLDSTIGEWFPAYAGTTKGSITLRQLLSHTSGWTAPAECLSDGTTTLDACVELILELPLAYPPGERFAYAGPPMQVAARMVELATGKPWVQVFADNVKTPMGLPTMHWGSDANPRVDGGLPPVGLRATAADYERVLEMLLDGGTFRGATILSPSMVHELITDQTDGAIRQINPNPTAAGYGIGTWVQRQDGNGDTTMIMSYGAFGSVPWVDFARGYAGWWEAQGDGRKLQPLWGGALGLIEGQVDAVAAAPRPVPEPPAIASLSVTGGPSTGGQTVVITGTGFEAASAVRFSSTTPASSFTVDSPTRITAVTPARPAGFVNVLVTTPHGTSVTGAQTLYRFADRPVITAISPSRVPATGGVTVTITGTGFGGVTGVRFGPSTWAGSFTVWSATTITAVVPARAAGLVNVFVQGPGGLSATSGATLFTYTA